MNILSFNIRGGSSRLKRKRIGYNIQAGKFDLCFLQETKHQTFDSSFVAEFWGSKDVEWTSSKEVVAFGGMVILWRKDLLSLNYSFKGGGFVGVNPDWKGGTYNFINMYASCNMVRRRNLWKALTQLKRKSLNEDWCLWGDFNTVSG